MWTVIGILIVLWLLGFLADVAGNLIHILIVVALVVFIIDFIGSRRGR